PQEHDALQDGVGLGTGGGGRSQHWKDVCRDVTACRRNQESPRALEAGGLPKGELLVAARAAPFFLAWCGAREQATGFATVQALLHRGQGRRPHGVPSVIRSPTPARRAPASAHSILSHTSRGSKLACIPASRKISTP